MRHMPSIADRRVLSREEFMMRFGGLSIAVLLPCYNEELTVAKCIADFREALPTATIYVYDNRSSDRTAEVAEAAGAIVRREPLPGKGNVVRRMFSDIDADIYLMADGDGTYDAPSAPFLVEYLLSNRLDMVVGARAAADSKAYRPGHAFGNKMLTGVVGFIFGNRFQDMLSGYRVFSRRFVKTFPALSVGFEIETELTVHALELRLPVDELSTPFGERPEGSSSKLSTIKDGLRILKLIVDLFKLEKPQSFFGIMAGVLVLAGLLIGIPVVAEFVETGLVPRLPTAVLSSALVVLSALLFVCGLILDTVTRGRRELKRLHYLSHGATPWRIP